MPKTKNITQARLKELLRYDPETGLFVWIKQAGRRVHVGDVAGYQRSDGYIAIGIDGVQYLAHRLVFLYMVGWMPVEVDHDDHMRDNNRWMNLNLATKLSNGKNQTLRSTNKSGICGVFWRKDIKKWAVEMTVNGKKMNLGYFTHKADAIAARKAAEIKYGFHENHGKPNREAA